MTLGRHSKDAALQPGGFDQRVDEEPQLLRLMLQSGDILPALRRQVLLLQQLGIQQEVGDGSLGLVGDVPDQGLDGILLLRQIFGRYGGCGEIVGHPGLQGGEAALVIEGLPELAPDGVIQHLAQSVQHPAGPQAGPDGESCRCQQGRNRQGQQGVFHCHVSSPPMCSPGRTRS